MRTAAPVLMWAIPWLACSPSGAPDVVDDSTTHAESSTSSVASSSAAAESTSSSTDAEDSSSSGAAADSSTGEPACGDGTVDPGEACDDADSVDGDGCNHDCVVSGTLLWTATHDGPSHLDDRGFAVATAPDGHIVAVGMEWGSDEETWIARFASDGTQEWLGNDGPGSGGAADVAIDSAGDLVVCGANATGAWIRKYDDAGTLLWESLHSEGVLGECRTLAITADDAVIAGGRDYPGLESQGWIGRWASDGSPEWSEILAYSQYAWPDDLVITDDGAVVGAGHEYGGVGGNSNWIARWESAVAGTTWDQHVAIDQQVSMFADDPLGPLLLIRRGVWQPTVDWIWLGGDGVEQPGVAYDLGEDVLPAAAAFDGGGNIAIVGLAPGEQPKPKLPDSDAWIGKFAPDGSTLWTATYDGPGTGYGAHSDDYLAVAIDADGAIVAVGSETANGEGRNVLVSKYAP